MVDSLYQKMAEQANQCETWVVVLVLAVLGYMIYRYLWIGVFTTSAAFTGWTFYTVLSQYDLSKEQDAVGFLVMFILIGLVVNGTLLYKAVTDS